MLLKKEHDPIVSGGLGRGGEFSIANSPKAFEILSSNLYQDKILAVIREITCNAADAHKVVGRPYSDIQVHLPTYTAPYFSVRDFGTGLSQDEIFQLYTTYFLSAKDDNNDLIGGFGLGTKAPFAVVDQFTVTSWYAGVKSSYVMYKNSGVPQVNLVEAVSSNEPSGIEVRLAVPGDYSTWVGKAENFFSWWNSVPSISGAKSSITSMLEPSNIRVRSPNNVDGYPAWATFKNVSYSTPTVAFMGLVPYTLTLSAIKGLDSNTAKFLTDRKAVFAFEIGELSINPSRETLSYDDATCAVLVARFTEVMQEFSKQAENSIKNAKTLYEARRLVWESDGVYGTHGAALANNILWQGKKVPQAVSLNVSGSSKKFAADLQTSLYTYMPGYAKSWRKDRNSWDIKHSIYYGANHEETFVWFPSITAKSYAIIAHNYTGVAANLNRYNSQYILIDGSTFQDVHDVMVAEGFPTPIDGTTLAEPPKQPRGTNKAAPTTQAYLFEVSSSNALSFAKSEAKLDLTDGGLYIPFFDGEPVPSLEPLRHAIAAGWLTKVPRIVGLRKAKLTSARFKKELDAEGWVEYNADWFQQNIPEDAIRKQAKWVKFHSPTYKVNPTIIQQQLVVYVKQHNTNPTWPGIQDFITNFDEIKGTKQVWASLSYDPVYKPAWFSTKQTVAYDLGEKQGEQLSTNYTDFLSKHPMLQYLDKYVTLPLNVFNDYMNR